MSDAQWEAAWDRYRAEKAAWLKRYEAWLNGGQVGAPPPHPVQPHIPGQRGLPERQPMTADDIADAAIDEASRARESVAPPPPEGRTP